MASVFLSYCHSDGRELAARVADHFGSKSDIAVRYDTEIPETNPMSLPQWMVDGISGSDVVIMLLTPDYIRYASTLDKTSEHHGIRFEYRLILERYYRHDKPDGCPIIPVAAMDMPVDTLPGFITMMDVSHLGDGSDSLERLYQRVIAVPTQPQTTAGVVRVPAAGAGCTIDGDALRQAVETLRDLPPIDSQAIMAVRECLRRAEHDSASLELARAFELAERIIKAAGDHELMRQTVDSCLTALDTHQSGDHRLRAKVLIHGRAWYLRSLDQLPEAVACVEDGIRHAVKDKDDRTVARGHRALARIYRRLAEIGGRHSAGEYLDLAMREARAAQDRFQCSGDPVEIPTALYVRARIEFARYQLLGKRRALRRAHRLMSKREAQFPLHYVRHRIEKELLRCQIHTESWRRSKTAGRALESAWRLLDQNSSEGASYDRLRALAHRASARLAMKSGHGNARQEADDARKIYAELHMTIEFEECQWLLYLLTARVGSLRRREVAALQRTVLDPILRLAIAAEFMEQIRRGEVRQLWGRRRALRRLIGSNAAR